MKLEKCESMRTFYTYVVWFNGIEIAHFANTKDADDFKWKNYSYEGIVLISNEMKY